MRFALISEVIIEGVTFISLLIYATDERGISSCVGEILKPIDDELIDDIRAYKVDEIQTDSKTLYRLFVAEQLPVLYRKTIYDTYRVAELQRDLIVELYELDSEQIETSDIPKWRLFVIAKLEKLIEILKTKGIKNNGN